jgi:hypothetical protein
MMEATLFAPDDVAIPKHPSFEERIIPIFGELRKLPSTPLIEFSDPRLEGYRQLGLDVDAIHCWINPSDTIFRRNRQQLLESFPILVPVLAISDISEALGFYEIAASIDRANPLIETISRVVGIGHSTVRYLMSLSPTTIGAVWINQPIQLFWAARITADRHRPTSVADWETFNEYWMLSGLGNDPEYEIMAGPGRSRNHMLEYLLNQLCRNGYSKGAKRRLDRITDGRPDRVLQTRDYFDFVAGWCSDRWTGSNWTSPTLGDSLLMRYPLAELVRQSMQWHLEINQQVEMRQTSDRMRSDCTLGAWPPLLQEPLEHSNLQAISLVCASDLAQEGSRLKHCVGQYVETCAAGHSHIVSIRDSSGRCLSTAEIVLIQGKQDRWEAAVQQHYGFENTPPPPECAQLLNLVLLKVKLTECQAWLQKIQAIHDERREEIEYHLYDARQENLEFNESLLRRILPDFEHAIVWLARESEEREDA